MELAAGTYLVEKKRKDIYDFFVKGVVSGRKGLWLTKTNPMELRSRHGFVSTVIIDLNEYIVMSGGKRRMEQSIYDVVQQFLNRYQNMIILVEDLDEVIKDSFLEVMELLKMISQSFLSANIVFIMVLDSTLEEDKINILKKEYEFIKI